MKSIWLAVVGLLLFASLAWAAPLVDYSIEYTIKKPDGSVSDFIKYYLRDGNKFRVEYLHPDGVAFTIEILRKDKRLVWSMDPALRTYFEVPLSQDAWERARRGNLRSGIPQTRKNRDDEVLKLRQRYL